MFPTFGPGPRRLAALAVTAVLLTAVLPSSSSAQSRTRGTSTTSLVSPDRYAADQLSLRTDVTRVASELVSRYRQTPGQVAVTLTRVGWSETDAARGLGRGLRLSTTVVHRTLVESARISSARAQTAILRADLTLDRAYWDGLGISANEAALGLKNAGRSAANAAGNLRSGGYTWSQIAGAMHGVYRISARQCVEILDGLGASTEEVVGAVSSAWPDADAENVETYLDGGLDAEHVAAALRAMGVSEGVIVAGLLAHGYSLPAVVAVLDAAGASMDQVGLFILTDGTVMVDGLAGVLDATAFLGLVGGYAVSEYLRSTRDAGVWKRLGELIRAVGWSATAAADALRSGTGWDDLTVIHALVAAGYAAEDFVSAFSGGAPDKVARALSDAGVTASEIAAALVQGFSMTPAAATKLLASLGIG